MTPSDQDRPKIDIYNAIQLVLLEPRIEANAWLLLETLLKQLESGEWRVVEMPLRATPTEADSTADQRDDQRGEVGQCEQTIGVVGERVRCVFDDGHRGGHASGTIVWTTPADIADTLLRPNSQCQQCGVEGLTENWGGSHDSVSLARNPSLVRQWCRRCILTAQIAYGLKIGIRLKEAEHELAILDQVGRAQVSANSAATGPLSPAQKTHAIVVEDRPPLSVEQAIDAVRISATNLRDVTMAQLVSAMADFDSKLYQLIAAVRADEDEKWRQRMETLNAVLPGKAECAESAPVDQQEIERLRAENQRLAATLRSQDYETLERLAHYRATQKRAEAAEAELARLRAPLEHEKLEEKTDGAGLIEANDTGRGDTLPRLNYGDRVELCDRRFGTYEGEHLHSGVLVRIDGDGGQSLIRRDEIRPLPSPPEAQK